MATIHGSGKYWSCSKCDYNATTKQLLQEHDRKGFTDKNMVSYEISRKGYLPLNFRPVKDLCCSFFINYVYSIQKVLNNYIVLKDNRRMRNLIKKNIFFSKSHKILDNIFVVQPTVLSKIKKFNLLSLIPN